MPARKLAKGSTSSRFDLAGNLGAVNPSIAIWNAIRSYSSVFNKISQMLFARSVNERKLCSPIRNFSGYVDKILCANIDASLEDLFRKPWQFKDCVKAFIRPNSSIWSGIFEVILVNILKTVESFNIASFGELQQRWKTCNLLKPFFQLIKKNNSTYQAKLRNIFLLSRTRDSAFTKFNVHVPNRGQEMLEKSCTRTKSMIPTSFPFLLSVVKLFQPSHIISDSQYHIQMYSATVWTVWAPKKDAQKSYLHICLT